MQGQVQLIVETQLLLRPYLLGRCKMHLLYKVHRADSPEALYSDFRAAAMLQLSLGQRRQDHLPNLETSL